MECLVRRITVEDHPNADRLQIVRVDGYQAVVPLDTFCTGDLAVYIPTGALLPSAVLAYMGLEGKLNRAGHNVVSAVKLRGVLSEGLVLPLFHDGNYGSWYLPPMLTSRKACLCDGDDVTSDLGIVKYEPKVSAGHRIYVGPEFSVPIPFQQAYDIDNIKKFPNLFSIGDSVVATEKLHGTLLAICATPSGEVYAASKGLLKKGYGYPRDSIGVYSETARAYRNVALDLAYNVFQAPVILYGEIVGSGIQDLHYGYSTPVVLFFDIQVGRYFVGYHLFTKVCADYRLPEVPVCYVGDYDPLLLQTLVTGFEKVSGQNLHMREGLVVKDFAGTKVAKYISEDYLLRKHGTEYN